jgi:hypothetical protein
LGGRPKVYDDLEELRRKDSVRAWQRGLKEGAGRKAAFYHLGRYIRWRREKGLNPDPDELVKECIDGTNRTLIQHLKQLQEYCETGPDLEGDQPSTRERVYRSVRGFYSANYISLPRAKLRVSSEKHSANHVRQEVTAKGFLGMVKKVISGVKLSVRDRSIILTMLQGGLDDSTLAEVFNYVAYPQLVAAFGTEDYRDWDVAKCPVRVWVNRPKTEFRYYTFQDVDSVNCMKEWLEIRERKYGRIAIHPPRSPGELPTSDPIYLCQNGKPIEPDDVWRAFNEPGKRAGINVANGGEGAPFKGARIRYPFHSHEVRDVMTTIARGIVDVEVPRFLTGHSIDRLGYDKSPWDNPDYFRNEYMKLARPWLNPISGEVLKVRAEMEERFEERLATLEKQVQKYASMQGV